MIITPDIVQQILLIPAVADALHHIAVLNQETGDLNSQVTGLSIQMATVTERVNWLCNFFWLVAIPGLLGLVATIYQIMWHRKNK